MENISLDKLHELYIDTLYKCGTYLLKEEDETIEYNIFEEFDIGVVSFLHDESLKKLLDSGFISNDEMNKSLQLRKMVLDIQNSNEWNIKAFRTSENWKKILELTDEINSLRKV